MNQYIPQYKAIQALIQFFGLSSVEELQELDKDTLKQYENEINNILKEYRLGKNTGSNTQKPQAPNAENKK